MTAPLEVVDAIVRHAGAIVTGVTIVLAVGCLAMVLCRRPAERRRLGQLTAMSCGLYLVLACVPLPRWEPREDVAVASKLAAITPPPRPESSDLPAVERRLAALLAATESLVQPEPVGSIATAPAASDRAMPTTAPLAPTPAPTWTWPRLAVVAWALLGAVMLLRALVGALRLWLVLRTSRAVPAAMLEELSLPRTLRLRVAARSLRPFCAYGLGPVVVIPANLLLPERRSQAIAVLQHELAHVRAGDPQLQLLLAALALPLAAHPLFWWLTRDLRFHAELLADDAAAAATGATRYARDLIDLAERAEPELAAVGAVPVFHRPSEFFRRIQMLLQREGRLSTSSSLARRFVHTTAAFVAVSLAAATFGVPAVAQDPAPKRDRAAQTAELRAPIDVLRAELEVVREALRQAKEAANAHGEGHGNPSMPGNVEGVPTPDASSSGALPRLHAEAASRWLRALHEPVEDARIREQLHTQGFDTSGRWPLHQAHEHFLEMVKQAPSGTEWQRFAEAIKNRDPLHHTHEFGPSTDTPHASVPAGANPHPTDPRAHLPSEARSADGTGHPAGHVAGHGQGHGEWAGTPDAPPTATTGTFPISTPTPAPRQEPEGAAASMSIAATAEIVSRCLDLKGDLEVAEMEAIDLKAKHEAGVATSIEHKRAAMKVATLQRKFTMVQRLIAGEVEATEREMKTYTYYLHCGTAAEKACAEAMLARAKARLDALQTAR